MDFDGREYIIKSVQRILNLKDDGVDGPKTWNAIKDALSKEKKNDSAIVGTTDILSETSYNLILKYEVGGGESYYNRYLKNPSYPGGASGVTIGVGYDLGYNSEKQFENDWKSVLSYSSYTRLKSCLGKKGSSVKSLISNVRDIEIPWDAAEIVFKNETIPRFYNLTLKTFPGCENLHPDAIGVLVSLVFNRGSSLSGDRRREMRNIKELVLKKDYSGIANEIRKMKRLWTGKGLDGLLKRRDEEAKIIESCI